MALGWVTRRLSGLVQCALLLSGIPLALGSSCRSTTQRGDSATIITIDCELYTVIITCSLNELVPVCSNVTHTKTTTTKTATTTTSTSTNTTQTATYTITNTSSTTSTATETQTSTVSNTTTQTTVTTSTSTYTTRTMTKTTESQSTATYTLSSTLTSTVTTRTSTYAQATVSSTTYNELDETTLPAFDEQTTTSMLQAVTTTQSLALLNGSVSFPSAGVSEVQAEAATANAVATALGLDVSAVEASSATKAAWPRRLLGRSPARRLRAVWLVDFTLRVPSAEAEAVRLALEQLTVTEFQEVLEEAIVVTGGKPSADFEVHFGLPTQKGNVLIAAGDEEEGPKIDNPVPFIVIGALIAGGLLAYAVYRLLQWCRHGRNKEDSPPPDPEPFNKVPEDMPELDPHPFEESQDLPAASDPIPNLEPEDAGHGLLMGRHSSNRHLDGDPASSQQAQQEQMQQHPVQSDPLQADSAQPDPLLPDPVQPEPVQPNPAQQEDPLQHDSIEIDLEQFDNLPAMATEGSEPPVPGSEPPMPPPPGPPPAGSQGSDINSGSHGGAAQTRNMQLDLDMASEAGSAVPSGTLGGTEGLQGRQWALEEASMDRQTCQLLSPSYWAGMWTWTSQTALQKSAVPASRKEYKLMFQTGGRLVGECRDAATRYKVTSGRYDASTGKLTWCEIPQTAGGQVMECEGHIRVRRLKGTPRSESDTYEIVGVFSALETSVSARRLGRGRFLVATGSIEQWDSGRGAQQRGGAGAVLPKAGAADARAPAIQGSRRADVPSRMAR